MSRNILSIPRIQKGEIEAIRFLRGGAAQKIQPFVGADSSVGMEYELQVAVEGQHDEVDLPITILDSNYYKNIVKRAGRGDLPSGAVDDLNTFIYENQSKVWENSWVRFEKKCLTTWTQSLLSHDLLADKKQPGGEQRQDTKRFICIHKGRQMLRLPISYVLKLALANMISSNDDLAPEIESCGKEILSHLLSDNTSPEVLSFTIPRAKEKRIGDLAASETARTLLVCQLLVQYANRNFDLLASGQKCLIYFAPNAPSRQKQLNELVPDGFYRHLFMSPCLSGWDRGEEKYRYMELCHKTLSRSQLNTLSKLKDAGIITNNLTTLPNTSNTCLANNGTHVSLGSRILTEMVENQIGGFTPGVEKYFGDLVIKIVEHFLPLFVGTYSAAPYRIDFKDFHPENVLGFLPHELDYTHLRMLWRRWKKKAKIGWMGRAVTPFGPRWLDSLLATTLRLKGDLVPDFRLVDYLVTLLSTESSPALNGLQGNHEQLKEELMEAGVFDNRLSIYLLYRQRALATSGYTGFEGRSYSLFHCLLEDMAEAVDMQNLITALAYKYIIEEQVCHRDIPDVPSIESERRQIFFGCAIGIPTFYVRYNTANRFMGKILSYVQFSRKSNRYRGYVRVKNSEYKLALLKVLRQDAAGLIQKLNVSDRLVSLEEKLNGDATTAKKRILEGVCRQQNQRKGPLSVSAEIFNRGMEKYFRGELKQQHIREGLAVLMNDCATLEQQPESGFSELVNRIAPDTGAAKYIAGNVENIISETADATTIQNLLQICLTIIHHQKQHN